MQSTSPKNQFYFAVLAGSSLAAMTVGLGTSAAFAQITIRSTGTVSGTFKPPISNPNFSKTQPELTQMQRVNISAMVSSFTLHPILVMSELERTAAIM